MKGGEGVADRRMREISKRLKKVYQDAVRDLERDLKEFEEGHRRRDAKMRADLAAGKITREQYESWMRGQVFQGKHWRDKLEKAAQTLVNADREAARIVNAERARTFTEAANAELQNATLTTGYDFTLYNQQAVDRLIQEDPDLLPPKKVNVPNDNAWYRRQISNCVNRSIISGDSVLDLARRIARETGESSWNAAKRNARTAMTAAQNAGRLDSMRAVKARGVQVRKKWLATPGNRTRDAHKHLNGTITEVDEPFQSDLGDIMYPGDPKAAPANVYNCRCALLYVYPDFEE